MKNIGADQHFPCIEQQGQKADGFQRDHLGLSDGTAQHQRRLSRSMIRQEMLPSLGSESISS